MSKIEQEPIRAALANWRVFAARRWPLLGGAGALLLIIAWAVARGLGEKTSNAAPEAEGEVTPEDSVVTLDTTAQRLAAIELVTVAMTANGALVANGTIAFDENRVSVVAPRAEGRIVNVRTDLGQQVREGTPVASMLSPDVGQARGDLDRARATVDVARRNYEREKRLFEQSISPEKEMLDAEVAYRTAEADVRSAAARLESLGATNGQGASYSLLSPISGTVVARNAMPGQLAGPETNLFTIADLRNVWITVDVYSGDLARVRHGALATVTSGALPGENFIGHVTYAGGIVDPSSRTFKVRVEVENARLRLRPGVYAQVRIESAEAASNTGPITVPEIAVQDLDGTKVVFVAGAVPGRYVVRSIVLGSAVEGGVVAVQSGLVVGERVVTRGAFQLKAELTKASFGEKE